MSNINKDIAEADKAHAEKMLHLDCVRIVKRTEKTRRGKKFRAPRPDFKCPKGFVKKAIIRKDAELRKLCGF